MIAPARVAAYQILRRVSTGRDDLPTAVADARAGLKDERDRALATEVATGSLRWRAALDHLIAQAAKRPISRLDAEVVDILRLSLYQLLHLTRVPASAVVDDAVSLTKKAGKKSAAGFVNAVLRQTSRARNSLPLPPRPADGTDRTAVLEYLSISLSHPRWLAARWLDRVGFDRAEAWMRFNNQPAPLTLRANRLRTTRDELLRRLEEMEVDAVPARYAPDGIVIESRPANQPPLKLRRSAGALAKAEAGRHTGQDGRHGNLQDQAQRGELVVQDEASQLVALLAGPSPGHLVLDTCASPGGKATAVAANLDGGAMLIACDVRERRTQLLRQTIATTGAASVRIVQADAGVALPFTSRFSAVIVDAPCSGLGTLRRDPDIRWKRDEASLTSFAAMQRRMLDNAASVVADGGRLVYATCSSEPEENEEVAAAFLDAHPDFRPLRADAAHPRVAPELVDANGHLRTEPDRHGLELFFGAVFERAGRL